MAFVRLLPPLEIFYSPDEFLVLGRETYIVNIIFFTSMNISTYIILGLGAIFLLPVGVTLPQTANPEVLAQSETTLADRVLSYITQADTSIAAGNTTDASDKLGVAIGELSNLIGEITSDNGKYNDTHTHTVTHNGKTTHIVHTHPHNANHHHDNWFQQHNIYNPSNCKPGLMC
jgi:hypothetical protein